MDLLVNPTTKNNVVAFAINGEIKKSTMDALLQDFEEKQEKHERVCLYGEIREIGKPENLEAFMSTLKVKLKVLGKVDKYAIVSDSKFYDKIEGVADFATPNMDIKVFNTDEKSKAVKWLESTPMPSLYVTGPNDNIFCFTINGKLRKSDYDYLHKVVDPKLKAATNLRACIEVVDLKGMTFRAIWEDLKTSFKYYKHFDKIAILGQEDYLKTMSRVGDLMTPGLGVKYFPMSKKTAAISWLK